MSFYLRQHVNRIILGSFFIVISTMFLSIWLGDYYLEVLPSGYKLNILLSIASLLMGVVIGMIVVTYKETGGSRRYIRLWLETLFQSACAGLLIGYSYIMLMGIPEITYWGIIRNGLIIVLSLWSYSLFVKTVYNKTSR